MYVSHIQITTPRNTDKPMRLFLLINSSPKHTVCQTSRQEYKHENPLALFQGDSFRSIVIPVCRVFSRKWKNIVILYISNVIFGKFYDCALTNKFTIFVLKLCEVPLARESHEVYLFGNITELFTPDVPPWYTTGSHAVERRWSKWSPQCPMVCPG